MQGRAPTGAAVNLPPKSAGSHEKRCGEAMAERGRGK